MNFQKIPYIKLTRVQKVKVLEILGTGTVLLKKWSCYFPPKKHRQFRNAIMDGSLNPSTEDCPCGVIPMDKLCEFHQDLPAIKAIRYKKYEELDNRTCEQAILEGFSAMAERFVHQWKRDGDPIGLTKWDFLQEAYMQIIEAIYSWLPDSDADISTFIWISLKNRMSNVANQQGNLLCRLTNDDLVLFTRYKKALQSAEHLTFDELVNQLGFSSEEGVRLNFILKEVYIEARTDDANYHKQDESDRNDYTGRGKSLRESNGNSHVDDVEGQDYVDDILSRAGLTDIEKEVMEAAMNPYNGWQTAFAANHINPRTEQPYSRMSVTNFLNSAKEKVAKVIKRKEKRAVA